MNRHTRCCHEHMTSESACKDMPQHLVAATRLPGEHHTTTL
jgi:hypothetical protein